MASESRTHLVFRPDLEGLRGVAILLVLACHAGIPGLGAGFVGVDVFFVLSGFLITGLLVTEAESTGRIQLTAFYARRARRILPAAGVAIVGTLLAASLILSQLDIPRIADDALAAGLSFANIHFALSATDYFAPVDPSPLLHFWSLSVEEQFYLAWPVLLGVAARRARPRLAMALIAAVVLAGSLLLCLAMTPVAGPWAYFSLPSRAWQLAAGGALALAGAGLTRLPRPLAAMAGWFGGACILLSLVAIEPTTAYPGIAAATPTVGALGLIAGGTAVGSPGWLLLQRAPLRWLGRISYSLYLWHWPVLVLGAAALGIATADHQAAVDPLLIRLTLVGAAVVVAALSTSLIERPFRAGRLARGGHRRWLVTAGTAVLAIAIGSSAMGIAAQRNVVSAAEAQAIASDEVEEVESTGGPVFLDDAELGQASPAPVLVPPTSANGSPEPSATPTPTASPKPRPKPRLEGPVPRDLAPSLAKARNDGDRLIADGCSLGLAGSQPPTCVYGDRKGSITIALVGDSHAANWFPAFRRLAVRHHWRLIPYTKSSCVFLDMRIWSQHLNREYTECATWRERVIQNLDRIKPDLVVIAGNRWFPVVDDLDNAPKRQGAATARLIDRIPGRVALMIDTPRSDHDVPACLAAHRDAIEACTTPKASAFGWRHRLREREAAKRSGAAIIDLSKSTCPTDPCPPIIGRRLVYRDHHHLTATFAASLADDLDAALAKVVPLPST